MRRKLNPLRENIAGKRVIVVDDSIVRGTTTRAMVKMLREAGATEVHLRISSPPFKWPCFYGIDTPDRNELLAATGSTEEIAEFLDVDSLEYLTLDHLVTAVDAPGAGFCDACLTGNYPVKVPVAFSEPTALSGVASGPRRVPGTFRNPTRPSPTPPELRSIRPPTRRPAWTSPPVTGRSN